MAGGKTKNREKLAWLRWGVSALLVIWAFILGMLVGQGTLASDQQLDTLRKLSLSWFGINFSKETTPQDPLRNPDLSFYEQLADTGGNTRNSQPSQPAPPAPPAQTAPPPVVPPTNSQNAAGQTAAEPEALSQSARPTPPPEQPNNTPVLPPVQQPPAPPAQTAGANVPLNQVRPYQPDAPAPTVGASAPVGETAGGRFTIQVGSFKDERQAQELAGRLKRGGFPAYISKVEISGAGTRFRVRVGGYANLDQAQNIATNLRLKENVAAYVTRND